MTMGAHRRIIPLSASNLDLWPAPDEHALSDEVLLGYRSRCQAIKLYAAGNPFPEIRNQTGLGEDEVQRLTKRCVTPHPDGDIYGFRALLRGTRIKGYERTAIVEHVRGVGHGGCSGALEQLFVMFPEVRAEVHLLFFDKRAKDRLPEAGMPIVAIHRKFKAMLRNLGLTDYDWPFNTENCGYKALWTYCDNLQLTDAQHATLSRSGTEAARRGAVGTGMLSCTEN